MYLISPPTACQFSTTNPNFPHKHLLQADFFGLDPAIYQFDIIIEQTFFCVIDPTHREEYTMQMAKLLYPPGTLFGVLFNKEFKQSPHLGVILLPITRSLINTLR